MTDTIPDLTGEAASSILEMIAPGSVLDSIKLADGSFSNYTHIVTGSLRIGEPLKVVVRRYKIFGDYDRGEKARREFKTFELLNQHDIPSPEALLLDTSGDVLGSPGIVTRFVEGTLLLEAPPDPIDWARKLARTLAKIHSIPCGEREKEFLLKGNAEVTWFLNNDEPPKYMQDHPHGTKIWHLMHEQYPKLQPGTSSLLHIDYWTGNILWHQNEISAVIDWEEAAYGDPIYDVAYARMNMFLMGLPDAADEFLRVYESESGIEIRNLGFWGLAAAVRPMIDPVDNDVASGDGFDRLQKFIAESLTRTD